MARKEYLSFDERSRFDSPPQLENIRILIEIPIWAENYLKTLFTSTNKAGFILQMGYFRVTTRFFNPNLFYEHDINLVVEKFKFDPNDISMIDYAHSRTSYRHQEEILREFSIAAFNTEYQALLYQEAKRLTYLQTKPTLIFDSLVSFLQEKRIEIPTYNALREIVTKALDAFAKDLEAIIQTYLLEIDRDLLEQLAEKQKTEFSEKKSGYERYELTFFKRITQSMQPMQIKERLELFVALKFKYQQLQSIIKKLKLSDATIRYLADYILDNQSSQAIKRVNEHYLQLIAFVIHQYFSLGDALILTLNSAVTSTFNDAEDRLKEEHYKNRFINAQLANQVTRRSTTHIDALGDIETIIENVQTDDSQKVEQIRQLIVQKRVKKSALDEDQERLNELKKVNQPISNRDDYYKSLEKESIKLQNRVTHIVVVLVFDIEKSQEDICQAVTYFQQRLQVPYWAQNYIAPCKSLIISNLQGVFLRYIFIFPSPYFINIKA